MKTSSQYLRSKTRKLKIGPVTIGGGSPIAVQSMTNTDTHDVSATVRQIHALENAGCEIVRVAVPDMDAAKKLGHIKRRIAIPLVADIHFDYRIALEAIHQGVDKLRINPGNIGDRRNTEAVVRAAKSARVPIRIGVNAGSLKPTRIKHSGSYAPADRAALLVASAMEHVKILESMDFHSIAVSLKASDVATTVEAYRIMSRKRDYPLHLGITEAGSLFRGTIKSSVGMGILLHDGIGDTIRVSLTADPVEEVKAAYHILQSLDLRSTGVDIVSCPTCSRCAVDLIGIVNRLEDRLAGMNRVTAGGRPLKVAVMGCVVNGPGESKDADFGIAGGRGTGLLFANGTPVRKLPPDQWVPTLIRLIRQKSRRTFHGK